MKQISNFLVDPSRHEASPVGEEPNHEEFMDSIIWLVEAHWSEVENDFEGMELEACKEWLIEKLRGL